MRDIKKMMKLCTAENDNSCCAFCA